MPAFNFQQRFAPDVESGLKHQTIRAKRKTRPRVGQTAHCFIGMRTKKCRKLGAWEISGVYDVKIMAEGVLLNGGVIVGGERDLFAMRDGFTDWAAMRDWFAEMHRLPFSGHLIEWQNASVEGLATRKG